MRSCTGSTTLPEREPRVRTRDVARALQRVLAYGDESDQGETVTLLAEKAGTSTRTVYRCLGHSSETLSLDLADRLLVAAGGHISECELIWD